ncbi:MAG TPA: phenylalanine--tRNA ligase subunit beta [Dongiaceae bacterium]|nr:phenylalanine--tRNA ligase subunit beta [Dongiaceae bacterium]
MRFSHAWIGEYVRLQEPAEAIGRRLTAAGIPLESIERPPSLEPGDAIYDFDILTNRPDCMNHLGLAREIAALYGTPLIPPAATIPPGGAPTAGVVSVAIEAPSLCRRYAARLVQGVRVAPSPAWLRRRLESIGQRAINNVVDATNFVLWEMGQPLHPFDRARLAGNRVVVREARAGESLVTLDGSTRDLAGGMLVIADAGGPVALAGIMGGRASEIGDATRDVFLESAWFDPVAVRRTARSLGMHTDASHRFERGADPGATLAALDRAAALIATIAGGQVTDPPIDTGPGCGPARVVGLRPARVPALLGYDPGSAAIRAALEALGFGVATDSPAWQVTVPTFRRDIEREEDLIEEVARLRGYDAIPSVLPPLRARGAGRSRADRLRRDAREALRAAGLAEAVNFAMTDADLCRLFAPAQAPVALRNPLQSGAASLRTTLLPGLLANLARNLDHGLPGAQLFEIGHAFRPAVERPDEPLHAAGVLAGRAVSSHWNPGWREVDFSDARGAVESLAAALRVRDLGIASDRIARSDGMEALPIVAAGADAGRVGVVAAAVARRFGIDRPVYAFEVDLAILTEGAGRGGAFRPLPRYPAVRRDLALVVPDVVTFDAIAAVVRGASALPIADVQVFDRFRGRGLPQGSASLAIQVQFQHPDRTLEADEVQAAQETIVAALARTLRARLRGPETD